MTAQDIVAKILPFLSGSRGDGKAYRYVSNLGREFDIEREDDGRFRMCEMRPIGRVAFDLPDGRVGYRDEPDVLEAARSANHFRGALSDCNIDIENVVFMGAGISSTTRYYDSLHECAVEIERCIAADEWCDGLDHQLLENPVFLAEQAEQEATARREYQTRLNAQHERSCADEKGIFKGLFSLMGGLSDDVKRRILSFLNEPCEAHWDDIAHCCVKGGTTVWQAWVKIDASAPVSKPEAGWPTVPDSATIRAALRELSSTAPYPERNFL